MKLSRNQLFCLREVAIRDRSTWYVCKKAEGEGLNVRWGPLEWADAPFRDLRKKGLIERTGEKDGYGRTVHRITQAGRDVLKGIDEAQAGV